MNANFVPGLDPTQLQQVETECGLAQELSASMLYQMISEALPATNVGMVYYASSAPDINANPERSRWLWINTANGIAYRYNATQSAWQQTSLASGSVSGSVLINDSVPLAKLQVVPGTNNMVIQVNASGSGYQLVSIATSIPARTLGVDRLLPGIEGAFLRVVNDTAAWVSLTVADLLAIIGTNAIPVTALVKSATEGHALQIVGGVPAWGALSGPTLGVNGGTTGKILTNDGTTYSWAAFSTFSVAWAQLPAGAAGQVVYHNGGSWAATDLASVTLKRVRLGPFNVPDIGASTASTAHGLAGDALILEAQLVCTTAHQGWEEGDIIPLALVRVSSYDNECPAFIPHIRAGNVAVFRVDEGGDILLPSYTNKKDTDAFSPDNWDIYVTVVTI